VEQQKLVSLMSVEPSQRAGYSTMCIVGRLPFVKVCLISSTKKNVSLKKEGEKNRFVSLRDRGSI
jgi:hypothetical protein